MRVIERMGRLGDRMFDRMRDKRAFTVTEDSAIDGDLSSLQGQSYAVLVTFRRNGEAMPSPVWFAVTDDGRAFVKTRHDAGKVKRLRHDPRVLIAPSTSRGKPIGPAIRATGRVLPQEEWGPAEDALAADYGAGRGISERVLAGPAEAAAYLEITSGR